MKLLNLIQGSPEWHSARGASRGASEAPAMMGVSPKCTRNELVRMKATGDAKEFSVWVMENLLARGHEVEAFARAEIEREIGEDLYPGTATSDDGYLLASPDGATMDGSIGLEAKLWNEGLAAQVRAGKLGPEWYWQLEQQIEVWGFEKIIFVVTDGTRDKFLKLEYRSVPGRIQKLYAGWKQFDEDVANYQHVDVPVKPAAAPTMALPALSIEVQGEVALVTNLDGFGEMLKAFIEGIPTKPSTDQEFANCEAAVATLQTAQDRLELAEETALAKFTSIDAMRRTIAMYRDLARNQRLVVEKLVESRKKEIRAEILRGGVDAFAAHIAKLNARLGRPYMPAVATDFPGAMKAKKSITSLRNGVDTELARAKIAANNVADSIEINLKLLGAHADQAFLFADAAQIVLKANDDFAVLVKSRIDAEAKRVADERERIRLEELAKIERGATVTSGPVGVPHGGNVSPLAPLAARAVMPTKGAASSFSRPTDDQIIAAVALHFHVHESSVIAWLLDMDLESASQRMATEFAR